MKLRKMIEVKPASGLSLLVIALALALSCPSIQAQEKGTGGREPHQIQPTEQSQKGLVLKGKAPVEKELLNVKLPVPQEVTLKNGLRVMLLEYHRTPTFSMRLVFMSGGLSDPPDHRGLAEFTATLLREGTTTRTGREINEKLDSLGASLSGNSGIPSFISFVSARGLVENFDQVFDIFADVIRNPKFPDGELEKYKTRTLSQFELLRSDPGFLANEQFYRAVYGQHPGAFVVPHAETIKKTTRADLLRFHSIHYRPNNATLLIVGDVTLKEIMPKIEREFGDWKQGSVPTAQTPPVPAQGSARIHLINRPDSVQTVLQLGSLAIERTHPDYFALLVMDRIIGGPSGRLFLNLREDKGYTYGVGSYFTGSNFPGVWLANSSVRTEVTDGAMREFMMELKRIREERVSPIEIDNAKRSLIGRFALSLEQPQSLLQNIFIRQIFDLPPDYWDTYPQKVAAVTIEDVQRVAQKYVDLQHLQVVAVGDAAKIREVLTKYGAVETDDGK